MFLMAARTVSVPWQVLMGKRNLVRSTNRSHLCNIVSGISMTFIFSQLYQLFWRSSWARCICHYWHFCFSLLHRRGASICWDTRLFELHSIVVRNLALNSILVRQAPWFNTREYSSWKHGGIFGHSHSNSAHEHFILVWFTAQSGP